MPKRHDLERAIRERQRRTRNLRILVSDHERAMIQRLADARGLSVADTLRTMIRRDYEALETASKTSLLDI